MLIAKLKSNLGKSSHGGQTLYDHTVDCMKVALRIMTDKCFAPSDYPKQKRDQVLFAMFIHDIGKLDPDFQTMLRAARDNQQWPSKRVKHEASTLDFEQLIKDIEGEVREHLRDVIDYKFTEVIDFDDVLAFAVSHHGLFYLSFEERNGQVLRRIRREWTVFNYGEQRRITLVDLLFDYHPLGGLVIIADLLGSFCYEQRIADADYLIGRARSLRELIEVLVQEGTAETVEGSIKLYDPRAYGLRDLLTLLAGGLA
ncbi:MAG TPA: hypothetical protein GX513_07255 [Firmicutes bacterium]|nr:hypothetical protein [Bacillota bacterium]